ncbi:TonB-dependent hemoglobin/transferrin/lactoferrin family receptor [Chromobacterium rhizoryzae]|uniref:TonB-dependent hemoglobin/transferrin/lactoferrin family receptor n=1 Tax=Chromobacterium rhizoryzae TaxID=1778675 RepID=UPI001D086BDB|nr:TonB-dependent hemoglobin/transferrin/lactoferrin family receptor [Chromobacterium rhizoryzae]
MPGCYLFSSCPDSISLAQNPPRFRPKALVLSLACLAAPGVWAAEAPARLDTVHVTADGPQARVGSNKLDREEIERPQARSLAEVLDALPGVNAGGSQRPGGQTINVWGFDAVEHVPVTLDGTAQNFDKYQQGTSFVDPELLGSVEVLKGGHSPFYGNGAFGGVVKAETKTVSELLLPGKSVGGFSKLSYQDNGHRFGQSLAAYAGGAGKPLDLLAYITHSRGGDGEQANGRTYHFSGGSQRSGMLKLTWRPATGHQFKLGFVQQSEQLRTPWAARGGDIPAPTEWEIQKLGLEEAWLKKTVWREQDVDSVSAEWRYASPDVSWLDWQLTYSQSRRFQHDRRPESAWKVDFRNSYGQESWVTQRDKTLEFRNVASIGEGWASQTITTGVSWSQKDWDPLSYLAPQAKNADYNYGWINPYGASKGKETMRSAYWVHEWRPLEGLKIAPSLRYDHVELQGRPNLAPIYNDASAGHDYRPVSYAGWSPRLALAWQFAPSWTVDAAYAHTWRAPNVDEVYHVQTWRSQLSGTSRQLKPETLDALRLGVSFDGESVLAGGDRLSTSLAWFQQNVHDNIWMRLGNQRTGDAPGVEPPKGTGFYRNLPGYVIQGFELESHYQWRGWFGSLSLSAMTGQHAHSLRDPWGKSEPMVQIPPRKAVLTFGHTFRKLGLTVGGQGKFVRAQDRVPQAVNPEVMYGFAPQHGYALAGLFASWQPTGRLKGVEVRAAVDNLYNREYTPYLTEGAEGMGRAIRTSVSWRF